MTFKIIGSIISTLNPDRFFSKEFYPPASSIVDIVQDQAISRPDVPPPIFEESHQDSNDSSLETKKDQFTTNTGNDSLVSHSPSFSLQLVNQSTRVDNQQLNDETPKQQNQNELVEAGFLNHSKRSERFFRSRKERKLKGIRIRLDKLAHYEHWCFQNRIDFQDAVETAMDWLTSGQPINHVLDDDKKDEDIDSSKSSSVIREIADFYTKWTGNTLTPNDRHIMAEILSVSLPKIKFGIIQALLRKESSSGPKKIKSFRYFLGSIQEVQDANLSESSTERILTSLMDKLQKLRAGELQFGNKAGLQARESA